MDEQEAEDRRTNCMLKKSLNVFFFFFFFFFFLKDARDVELVISELSIKKLWALKEKKPSYRLGNVQWRHF